MCRALFIWVRLITSRSLTEISKQQCRRAVHCHRQHQKLVSGYANDIVINNGVTLSLSNGSTLALAGGDITVNNAVVRNLNGGDIEVTAAGNTVASEIPVGGTLPATIVQPAVIKWWT